MKRVSPRQGRNVEDFKLKFIGFGRPGSGKTGFVASANQCTATAPLLLINVGGNPEEALMRDPTLVVCSIDGPQELELPYDFLLSKQPGNHPFRKAMGIPADVKFKSVGIDTITDWQLRKALGVFGGDKESRSLTNIPEPKPGDWQTILNSTASVGNAFINMLDLHTFIMVQEKTKVDFTDGSQEIVPWMLSSAGELLPSWVPLMGWFRKMTPTREVREKLTWPSGAPILSWAPTVEWDNDRQAYTKNQLTAGLGSRMWVPTVDKIMSKIYKHFEEINTNE